MRTGCAVLGEASNDSPAACATRCLQKSGFDDLRLMKMGDVDEPEEGGRADEEPLLPRKRSV